MSNAVEAQIQGASEYVFFGSKIMMELDSESGPMI